MVTRYLCHGDEVNDVRVDVWRDGGGRDRADDGLSLRPGVAVDVQVPATQHMGHLRPEGAVDVMG